MRDAPSNNCKGQFNNGKVSIILNYPKRHDDVDGKINIK